MFVAVGCSGRNSDSDVFKKTELYKKLETKKLLSSSAGSFKRERKKYSILIFIGDEAFPLSENLMKVYPGQHPKDSKKELSITGSAEPEEL